MEGPEAKQKMRILHKWLLLLWLVLPMAVDGPVLLAQEQPGSEDASHQPDTSRAKLTGQRMMQIFDFEERGIHFLPQPMHWSKMVLEEDFQQYSMTAEGFPHYSTGQLDSEHHRSGQYSFELVPDGASVAFAYDRRQIRAKSGSDFQVTGYVHFEYGKNCRAQISCALVDRLGRIIPGSPHVSQLIGQDDQAQDGWARLEVYVPGQFPDARYITVGLWVLQEEQWNSEDIAVSQIFQNNVKALAWFDDIAIYQLPRVILRTDRDSNVFDGDETALLEVEVEGVGILDYYIRLTVRASDGRLIWNDKWMLTGVEGQSNVRTIRLENIPAGLYNGQLEILTADTLVATRRLTFAKLAKFSGGDAWSGKGFGIIKMEKNEGDWNTQINLTKMANAKLLKLPVWRRHDEEGFLEKDFDLRLIDLQRQNIQVVAVFSEVPDSLAMKMDIKQRDLLNVLSQDVELWRLPVAFVLAQYARQIPFWQIGGDFDRGWGKWDPRIRPVIDTIRKEFDDIVRNTVIAASLDGMLEINAGQLGTSYVAMKISSAISPKEIPAYLQSSQGRGLNDIWATIEPLSLKDYHRREVLIDFAKRIAYAKKGHAEAIFIDHPWEQRQSNARTVTEPTELFLVFRTLADQLGSMRYVGEFEIQPGIPALVFDGDGQGCLFTWNENYDPQSPDEPPELQFYLGESPEMVDLFGNRTELSEQNRITRFRLTQWPVLISKIDSRIAMLRSSLELTPSVLDASISRQRLQLKFVNPFNTPVSGRLRFMLNEPCYRNWRVDPSTLDFVLQPNQVFEQQVTVKFPSNELGGKKDLKILFSIDANRSYNIQTRIPFEISLLGIDVNLFTRRIGQSDLLIQQVVTNESDNEVSLRSFVDLPDQSHLERSIPQLQPGATVTKAYLVRDARKWRGKIIRIGLDDPKGTKRVNYHIDVN